MNMHHYLTNIDAMTQVSTGFSARSNGVLIGAIGALDGWLVRIIEPSWRRDSLSNNINLFSRKGFYALNIQCLVDHTKRVLWTLW